MKLNLKRARVFNKSIEEKRSVWATLLLFPLIPLIANKYPLRRCFYLAYSIRVSTLDEDYSRDPTTENFFSLDSDLAKEK